MKIQRNLKQFTSILSSILQKAGYQIRDYTGGWHLHKGNIYCGNLQYQKSKGWQGSALRHLPSDLLERLTKLTKQTL